MIVVEVVGVRKVLAMVFEFVRIDFRDLKITIVQQLRAFLLTISGNLGFVFVFSLF